MKSAAELFPGNLRLARITLRVGLCLGWLAEIACGVAQHFRITRKLNAPIRHAVRQVTKVVGVLLLVAATQQVKRKVAHAGRCYAKEMRRRIKPMYAFIGGALKRKLRGLGNSQRIAALAAMLRAPEKIIATLVRRLKRGLTRTLRYAFDFAFAAIALTPRANTSANDSS
ncbi:hypothetical protein U91I_04069 [alpha proteobacterium U9-1i]|nr:hypothetical protein U91I_04069 [alpha proteobacterium U9-1i]